ncbi:hypothetical protein [Duganella sp. Root1480D1]|uniref:hypothetical protein n=1 Tax=Duganella sp. Root1480D1 TaxID=1736471 RepID=UPI0007139408|nr:hypothetical protein [Duganella sp. Root1480D1]KQZ44901.1 hypothetical protein ASD58_01215 [Duganella sp. Root1480D1]
MRHFLRALALVLAGPCLPAHAKKAAPPIEDWAGTRPRGPANLMLGKKLFSADDSRRWAGLLKEMRADGTLQRLIAQYVGQDEASRMLSPAP